jgi:hypothetical protein
MCTLLSIVPIGVLFSLSLVLSNCKYLRMRAPQGVVLIYLSRCLHVPIYFREPVHLDTTDNADISFQFIQ